MPYKIVKQDCKRSDGTSGSYVLKYKPKKKTSKKKDSKGFVKAGCHTSKKKAGGQRAAIEGPRESLDIGSAMTENELRKKIRKQLLETYKKASSVLKEEKVDTDLDLAELEGLNLPPVLKKLLDPDISPAKYASFDQAIDASGNINHQGFAIAAFILSYADMDEGAADKILMKAKAMLPKIIAAREKKAGGS